MPRAWVSVWLWLDSLRELSAEALRLSRLSRLSLAELLVLLCVSPARLVPLPWLSLWEPSLARLSPLRPLWLPVLPWLSLLWLLLLWPLLLRLPPLSLAMADEVTRPLPTVKARERTPMNSLFILNLLVGC